MDINRIFKCMLLALLVSSIVPATSLAQEFSPTESGINSNYYRTFAISSNRPTYRDFATSPLFYDGQGMQLQTAWLKRSRERERIFEVGFDANLTKGRIPKSNYLQPNTGGFFFQLHMRYRQLWELHTLSTDRNNIKLGGIIQSSQSFRLNPHLSNNSLGIENLSNVMVTGQITRDISRSSARQVNLGVFNPTLNPVKRDLRFQLNVGVVNLNYRPRYSYGGFNEVIGLDTAPVSWLLKNYKWSLNGWRLNTELEYKTYLPNGNARSLSYVWDASHVPGRYENFQLASHQLRYTYYFHTKTR